MQQTILNKSNLPILSNNSEVVFAIDFRLCNSVCYSQTCVGPYVIFPFVNYDPLLLQIQ